MKFQNAWASNTSYAAIIFICSSLLAACGGGGGSSGNSGAAAAPPSAVAPPAPPTIGAAGGTVTDPTGAMVIIPADALAADVTIRIAKDSTGAPALPAALTTAGNTYAITPHGTTFAQAVDVQIPAPNITLQPNQELKLAKAQPGGEWLVLGDSTLANGMLTAKVTSFSFFSPVIITYQQPLVQAIPFAVAATVKCGNKDCYPVVGPADAVFTFTPNGGQLPSGCTSSSATLRSYGGFPPGINGAPFDTSKSTIVTTTASPQVDARVLEPAKIDIVLKCNGTYFLVGGTSISWRTNLPRGRLAFVRVAPSQLDVVAGISANLDAILTGGGSALGGSEYAKPLYFDQATIDWQRSDDDGKSWNNIARSYEYEANPNPLGTGFAWLYWSVSHSFIAAPTDQGALFRTYACYRLPELAGPILPSDCIYGSATRLNVLPQSAVPAIVDTPRPVLIRTGQTATFSASANGTPTPTLLWQTRAANDTGAWADVSASLGATSNTYTTAPLTLADNGRQYRVVATNAVGSAASVAVTASVSDVDVAPTITTQPASLAVVAGSEAVFAVAARGTEALGYQWSKNGTAITGANSPVLRLPAVSATDGASYAVMISNAAGTITSQPATLTVSAGVAALLPPAIVTQPTPISAASGFTATFAVGVDGSGPFSFQWFKDGIAISGETRAVLTLANVASSQAGSYSVAVSNSVSSVTSQAASLTVTSGFFTPSSAPVISTQPSTAIVAIGGSATFAVAASGSGTLAYQWSRDGTLLSGANGPVLSLRNISALDTGNYTVTVSNSLGAVTSTAAPVILLGAPAIATQVAPVSVIAGNAATFSVTATGDGLGYLWLRNGLAIPGATSSTYTIANPTVADSGAVFSVIVYNGAGVVLSQNVVLTVAVLPSFTANPVSVAMSAGGAATFTVNAQNTTSLRWQRNGVDLADGTDSSGTVIAGAASSTLSLGNVPPAWNGSLFSASASNSAGTINSSAATLTVNTVVAKAFQPSTLIECDDRGDAVSPQVVMDGNDNAVAVWAQSDGIRTNIWSNRYVNGSGWNACASLISFNTNNQVSPQVGIDSAGNVIAAWQQETVLAGPLEIWASRNVGGVWSPAINVGAVPYTAPFSLAVSANGSAMVVWKQVNVQANRLEGWSNYFTPTGGWGTPALIPTTTNYTYTGPFVAIDANGNAIVVWNEGADSFSVNMWARSYSGGVGGIAQMIDGPAGNQNIAMDANGNAVLVYTKQVVGVTTAFANKSTGLDVWGTPVAISNGAGVSTPPFVKVNASGAAVAVWGGYVNRASAAIYSASTVPGSSWSPATRIDAAAGAVDAAPAAAIDASGNAFAVWNQSVNGTNRAFASRYPVGAVWGARVQLQSSALIGRSPQIAVNANGNATVVWYGETSTVNNISAASFR